MVGGSSLNERERQVLEAVIETYVETAEPAGSRTIARRFGMGLSAATIRNTMSDLEEKGYLYHPHTSAGRIPTDIAYRVYVDSLIRPSAVSASESHQIREELVAERSAVEEILARAAQVLGVLTKELGVAASPTLDEAVLDRLELLQVSSDRLLLVLTLQSGAVRTIFVEVPAQMAAEAVVEVAVVLNGRFLAGLHPSSDPRDVVRPTAGHGVGGRIKRLVQHLHSRSRRPLRCARTGWGGGRGRGALVLDAAVGRAA